MRNFDFSDQMQSLIDAQSLSIDTQLNSMKELITRLSSVTIEGKIISAIGTIICAYLPNVKVGDLCVIYRIQDNFELYAEVIALDTKYVKLLPYGNIENISQNCKIKKVDTIFNIEVSDKLLGKVVNGFGKIIGSIANESDEGIIYNSKFMPIIAKAPDPLTRPIIDKVLLTGVKAIDLFLTCGLGQRIGIFSGPGMGKTTLMGMILRNAQVDVIVVSLIGERGREVREFLDLELSDAMKKKCIVVVATSDRPPVEQVKCAFVAQTIAEYFRDQGKNVLLFMDSITRFARAQREVGISAGEPIARNGFPPSVFLSFPKLMERAGASSLGSISAFYTILMESDNTNQDPIADEVRSILDGHIILSEKLAEKNHFPAINILQSLSRVADRIITPEHLNAARHLRLLLSKYEELEFLLRVGEYKEGQDRLSDEAIKKNADIMNLVKQKQKEKIFFADALKTLIRLKG